MARSSRCPGGALRVLPSMPANCVNVSSECSRASPFLTASAQRSNRIAFDSDEVSQPSLPSSPASRRTGGEFCLSHNRTAWPWLFRSTSTGAQPYHSDSLAR
jgi:hypothetical protein